MQGKQGAGLAILSRRSLQGNRIRAQFWLIASINTANCHTLARRWLFHVPESQGEGFVCLYFFFTFCFVCFVFYSHGLRH